MACLELTLKKIHKKRNYILEEIKNNDLMNENHKKTYKYLSYFNFNSYCGSVSISAIA